MQPRPQDSAAEQALIGAVLVHDGVYERDQVEGLEPQHFSLPIHGRVWSAIRAAKGRGEGIDPVTLAPFIEGAPELASYGGGLSYLGSLAANAVTTAMAEDYARLIREHAIRRGMMDAAEAIQSLATHPDPERSIEADLSEAERLVASVADRMTSPERMVELKDALDVALSQAETASKAEGRITGLTTGLLDLDRALGGLHGSDLVVLAGRPAMGKTSLATGIARAAAGTGKTVAFFSLEMSADQLAMRLLCEDTGITTERIRGGRVGQNDLARLAEARHALARLPLMIDDTPAASVSQLRLRARRLKRMVGLDLIVVDYIQLIQGHERADNRVQELSRITRDLKLMAKEFHVPVLALSQLSRALESREDKRPILSDLRESGSIEQDADLVMFLYRDEVYVARDEPREKANDNGDRHAAAMTKWQTLMEAAKGKAEVIIAKHRHGPTRTVGVRFNGERTRFENLARSA